MHKVDTVVVVGASGFGRETLGVLRAMQNAGQDIRIGGVVDDDPAPKNIERLQRLQVPYIGTISEWLNLKDSARYVIAIGDPVVRLSVTKRLEGHAGEPFTAIHPSSTVGDDSMIGKGVVICAGATISTNVRVSDHVHVNPGAIVGHDVTLHEHVSINPGSIISGEVSIHSRTMIGAGAVVLQELTVFEEAIVGAGAVVTRNVSRGSTVKGVPAR